MNNVINKNLIYNISPKRKISLPLCYSVNVLSQQSLKERDSTIFNKKKYLEIYGKTLNSNIEISGYLKIGRTTPYHWKRNDPIFKKELELIKSLKFDAVEDSILKEALKGNISAAKFVLKNRHPDYKKNISNKETKVNIYHHTDKKEEKDVLTLEDLFDNQYLMEEFLKREKRGDFDDRNF